jgi:hypothetical protein
LLAVHNVAKAEFRFKEIDDSAKRKYEEAKSQLVTFVGDGTLDLQNLIENEKPTTEQRVDRLSLMSRIRACISRGNQARNMHTRSCHILRQGLINLYRYCGDARQVESGYEK